MRWRRFLLQIPFRTLFLSPGRPDSTRPKSVGAKAFGVMTMTFVLTTARRPSIFENGTLTGMICMTAAMLLLPIGDTLSKL